METKTTLAQQLGRRSGNREPDSVWGDEKPELASNQSFMVVIQDHHEVMPVFFSRRGDAEAAFILVANAPGLMVSLTIHTFCVTADGQIETYKLDGKPHRRVREVEVLAENFMMGEIQQAMDAAYESHLMAEAVGACRD